MTQKNSKPLLCPSYSAEPGAQLFGIVNQTGLIDYLSSTIEVNQFFIDETKKGRTAEERFRFAGNCAKNGCKQWDKSGNQCGLLDSVIEVFDKVEIGPLPNCAIRDSCRWFAQRSESACYNCNEVIRNLEAKIHVLENQSES